MWVFITKISFHLMNEKSLSNHLPHPACHWQAWEEAPWVGESSALQKRSFQILSTTHCSCFWLHIRWTPFFQLSLTSYTWNDTPSPHSHPKCYEHFGRKSCGNVKHYFRNRILVAAKLLQALCLEAICLPHLFLCVGDTLYHPR